MPSSRTTLVTVAVVLSIAVGGCGAFQGGAGTDAEPTTTATDTPDDIDGDAIAQRTVSALRDVDTYTYDSTVTTRSNGTATTLNVTGVVDSADRRLRFQQSVGGRTATQYVVDDTIYLNSSGNWVTRPLGNGSFWSEQTPIAEQRAILERSNATLVGTTTVDGTAVYELSVNVSDDQLLGYLRQRLGAVSPEVSIHDVNYTVYVSRSNYRLERVTADMTVSLRGNSLTVSTRMNVGDYGDDVAIELPPEATANG